MPKDNIVLLGCGDVGPSHEPVDAFSTLARPILASGDIRFAQCERLYSERGTFQVQSGVGMKNRLKPHMISVFSDCGFDVISMAGNHAMDLGEEALLDTVALFQQMGIQAVGAGRNLEEARQPAIIERHGVRVAFLGYCSVLREGYAAGPNKAGIAPLRAHTYYEAIEYQPGFPPQVVTVPYEEDLAGLVEDVTKAKKAAHVVVVSLHWGIHHIPRVIADYQTIVCKAAFKAGADLILGHHPHIVKAIGVHSGKVCFYSLSHFMMSDPGEKRLTPERIAHAAKRYGVAIDPDYLNLSHGHVDAKRSLIAKAVLSRHGVETVSFLPVQIDKQLRPEVLRRGDPRFDEAVKYMDWASEEFDHKFVVEGDEVIVTGAEG